jgi:hypothetical protein
VTAAVGRDVLHDGEERFRQFRDKVPFFRTLQLLERLRK